MNIKNERFFVVLQKFLRVYLVKNRCCSSNTIKSYTAALNLYFNYLESEYGIPLFEVDWDNFDYACVSGFLVWLEEKRKCGKQTQNQRLAALRSFVQYAGIIDISVLPVKADIDKIKLKKGAKKLVSFLTKDELQIFLHQPDITKPTGLRNLVFLVLMYDTAARCQEMMDLKLSDVDLKKSCVYLTGKGSKTRVVPIMPKTTEHIRNYINKFHQNKNSPNEYLFYTVSHGERHRMSEDNAAAFIKKYGAAAKKVSPGIPDRVHPHMLRHTRAMHLYQGGMPMAILSDLLGHSQMETTRIYAYADTVMKREAIQKANAANPAIISDAIWKDDEEMLRKLSGLSD